MCALLAVAVRSNIDCRHSNEFGHPGTRPGCHGLNAGAPDGKFLHRYKSLGRSGPYSACRTRCGADAARDSPRPNPDGLRYREHHRSKPGTNAPNGVSSPRLHLRKAAQRQLGTPQAVGELKIVCKPRPCALSRHSAEGLALRRLFRSSKPGYGFSGLLVRSAREQMPAPDRSHDRAGVDEKRAI
jgi:hypothetical protein